MKTHLTLFALLLLAIFQPLSADSLCKSPDALVVSNLTTNSVTVSWGLTSTGDNPTAFSYTLTSNGATVAHQDSLICPTMSYNITGLTANTTYTVQLAGNCKSSYSGYSDVTSVTFTTLCTPLSAPYTEDFNTQTTLPACTFSSNASLTPNGRSGRCLEFNTSAGSSTYFLFPELTLNSDTAEISFFLKVSSIAAGNSTFQVGLCTDPSDVGSSFEPLFNGSLSNIQWNEIRMNTSLTSQPVTPTTMIAILFPLVDNLTYYLDDVSIHAIPTCVRPEQLSLAGITPTTATLAWTQSTATSNRIYAYSATDTRAYTVGTSPATITNLTANTDYTFQIRALCSATDSSEINPYPVSAHTLCLPADSAQFAESFEDVLGANTAPDCWSMGWLTKTSGNTKTAPFSVSTVRAHTGSRSMTLLNQQVSNRSYLASRQLPISQSGQYTLSIWIYREDASATPAEGLSFYISPSPDDLSNATLLGFVPRDYATTPAESAPDRWYNYEYVINSTGNQYVVIEGISQNGDATFFDDVEVKTTPTCFKVTDIRIADISSSSIDITWTPGSNESQWIVDCVVSADNGDGSSYPLASYPLATPLLHIDSLAEGTQYTISGTVRSLCGVNDTADAVPFSFTFSTECSPLTSLPYICGFESSETASSSHPLPFCWHRYNDAPGVYDYYPQVAATSPRSGSNCLVFQTSSWPNYGDNQVAILPQIDTSLYSINTLRLSFHVSTDALTQGNLVSVGVMSDPDDFNSFSVVDSFQLTNSGYVRHVSHFSNYHGNGSYIAICVHKNVSSTVNLYVDDVTIAVNSSCTDLNSDPVVSDIMDTSVRITINDPSAYNWSYAYGLAGTPATACAPVDTNVATLIIPGLLPRTDYVIYARRKCGTEYGVWSDGVFFTTACGSVTLPFSDDFESTSVGTLAGCYSVSTDDSSNSLNVLSGEAYNHTADGSKGICTSLLNAAFSTNKQYTITQLAHLTAGSTYQFSLYAKAHVSNGILDWNLSFLEGSNLGGLNVIQTSNVATTTFTRYVAYFTATATGDFYFGIRTSLGNSLRPYYPYIDDIQLQEVTCIPPLSSQVNAIAADSAEIGFSSSASLWEVYVSNAPISTEDISSISQITYHDTISVNNFTLNNLSPNTLYYYTIRTLCGTTPSDWMQPATFRTLCDAASIPYSEGFESPESALCWSQIGTSGSVSRSTTQHYSDAASLKIAAATVATPEFNVTSLAPYMITGWALSPSAGTSLVVQLSTDITDASAASDPVATLTIPQANTWHEFTIDFASFLGDPDNSAFYNARYILLSTGLGTVFLDDIMVNNPPLCPKPTSGSVSNIAAHQALVDWSDTASAGLWIIKAVPDTGATVLQNATSHPCTLTGLNAATNYMVYVASVCQSAIIDTSYWFRIGKITTGCDYVTAPYSETFDAMPSDSVPLCWDNTSSTTATLSTNPELVWGVDNGAIRMLNTYTAPGTAEINSPEIILDSAKRYRLCYDYCNQANCGDLSVSIKTASDSSFTLLATHPSNGGTDAYTPSRMLSNELSINAYAGDTVQIQFSAVGNYGRGSIWVDNFRIREATAAEDSCVAPSVSVSVSPDLSLNVTTDATSPLRWALSTTQNITDTILSGVATTDTFTIQGLNASTTYYLFVRTECTQTDHSPWVTTSFITPCGSVSSFPYFEDFESTTFPPRCWTNISLTMGTGWQGAIPGSWVRSTYVMSRFGNGTGWASLQGSNGASALLVTPALALQSGREYHVSFTLYRSHNSIFGTNILDQLKIYVGNSPSTSGALLLADYVVGDDNLSTGIYTYDLDIPANMSGDCYVMFEGIFNNYGAVRIDDIRIDIYPRCRDLANSPSVVSTTATTATVSETMTLNNIAVQFGIAPYSSSASPSDITTYIISDSTGVATFSSLTPGTSYSVFARGICTAGDTTAWTSATKITTKATNCFAPDGVHTTAVSDTSVTIVWNTVPDASSYQCIVKGGNLSDTTTVSTASFTAVNLTQNTSYLFYVEGNCSSGSTGISAIRFKTISHPATLPYHTGFEPTDDNANWVCLSSSKQNNFTFGTDVAFSDSTSLYISDDDSTYHQTPPSDATSTFTDVYGVTYMTHNIYFPDSANYEVTFDWRCDAVATNSSSYTAYGRAFLAPLSASLPVDNNAYMMQLPADAISLGSDLTDDSLWQRSATVLTISQPTYMNLVFMWYSSSRFNSATAADATPYPLAIDNVSISEVTCLPVSSLTLLSVGDTVASVQVTRTEGSSIEYALSTVNNQDSIVSVATVSHSDTINLNALTPSSTYYLYVRTRCDSLNVSSWRSIKIATTDAPASLPYTHGFEDISENVNWHYAQTQTNQFMVGNATSSEGTHSLYISDDGSSYNYDLSTESFAYAYRIFHLPAGFYEFSYDWKSVGELNHDFARLFLLPSSAAITPGAYLAGLDKVSVPVGSIALDGGSQLSRSSDYVSVSDTFSLASDGYYNLVVFWHNDGGSGLQPPFSLDNLSLRPATCLFPVGSILSVGDTTATALVTNRADSSLLVYAVSPTMYLEDAVLRDTLPAATDTLSLYNLAAATDYYLMLRSLCDSADESIWHRIPFRTHCSNDTSLVIVPTFSDTICHAVAYTLHGFNVPASQLNDGWNSLSRLQVSSVTCVSDTLYTADVFVRSAISTSFYDTICGGVPYVRGRWNIPNPSSRRYFSTFTSACGCDSTVDLYLYVLPTSQTLYDTICMGGTYSFGDTLLTTPGTYVRTYIGQYGCSDTTFLHLFVADTATTVNATICQGDSYLFEGQSYTQPGTYRVTVVGVHSCPLAKTLNLSVIPTDSTFSVSFCQGGSTQVIDTVISTAGYYEITRLNTQGCYVTYHVTATVTAPVPQQVYDIACQGHLYSGYGISGITVTQDTVVTVTTRTIDGSCDSLAYVNLTYIPTLYGDTFAAINTGESFTWYNQTYNQTGEYTETLTSQATGCDSIVTLHLYVRGAGVEDVGEFDITLLPNPAPVSSTITIYCSETILTINIINQSGQLVQTYNGADNGEDNGDGSPYPLKINGITSPGIYYVRIATTSGKVYTRKLIVCG